MNSDNWSRPDILKRFRWRLALYKLGWAWLVLAFLMLPVAAYYIGSGAGFGVWFAMAMVTILMLLPASTCLNCGASMRNASLQNGFNCSACGAVHDDPNGVYLSDAPSLAVVLPKALERCWLYPPLLVKYAARQKRARVGMVVFCAGLLSGVLWMAVMKTGWNPLPVNPHAYLVLFGICFTAGLALHFGPSRCPHCWTPVGSSSQGGAEHTNTLAIWCGWCGAVLSLKPEARRAFMLRGKLVSEPPDSGELETEEELIDEAERLLQAGDDVEAFAVIDRAMHRYRNSDKITDWLMQERDQRHAAESPKPRYKD